MKVQFATIEAGVALVLIVSAITFASAWTNAATANLGAQSSSLQRSIALYDIVNAVEHNSTYGSCALLPSCVAGMEENLSSLFRIGGVSIGTQIAQNSTCVRTHVANQTLEVCVYG